MEYTNVDEYINSFSLDVGLKLKEIREMISRLFPSATQSISWGMPTFKLNKNQMHFAAFKNHIGIYPGPEVIEKFKSILTNYKTSKGAIQFKLSEDLPISLIKEITEYVLNKER